MTSCSGLRCLSLKGAVLLVLLCSGCFVQPERVALEADPVGLAAGAWQTKTDAVTGLTCQRAGVLNFDGDTGTAQLSVVDEEVWGYVVSLSADGELLELGFECQDCGTAGADARFGAVCRFEEFTTMGIGWFPSADGLRCQVAGLGEWYSSTELDWCIPVVFGHLQRA